MYGLNNIGVYNLSHGITLAVVLGPNNVFFVGNIILIRACVVDQTNSNALDKHN